MKGTKLRVLLAATGAAGTIISCGSSGTRPPMQGVTVNPNNPGNQDPNHPIAGVVARDTTCTTAQMADANTPLCCRDPANANSPTSGCAAPNNCCPPGDSDDGT